MAEWKPFDLTWGRSIYYCSECEESVDLPTAMGKPIYKYCPMCGAKMNADRKTEPKPSCQRCKHWNGNDGCDVMTSATAKCKYEPQTDCDHRCIQTEIGCEQTDCPRK